MMCWNLFVILSLRVASGHSWWFWRISSSFCIRVTNGIGAWKAWFLRSTDQDIVAKTGQVQSSIFLIVDIIPGMIFLPSKMHQLLDETFHESLLLRCAAQKNLLWRGFMSWHPKFFIKAAVFMKCLGWTSKHMILRIKAHWLGSYSQGTVHNFIPWPLSSIDRSSSWLLLLFFYSDGRVRSPRTWSLSRRANIKNHSTF